MTVGLMEKGEVEGALGEGGTVWLYESREGVPSLGSFDLVDKEVVKVHRLVVEGGEGEEEEEVFLGVRGSPVGVEEREYGFDIVAWQSVFE